MNDEPKNEKQAHIANAVTELTADDLAQSVGGAKTAVQGSVKTDDASAEMNKPI
jgi:hypothetical protein